MYTIVANMFFLKKIREIDQFKLDLGKSLKKGDDDISYDDEFIYNYKLNFKRIINNFGKLGSIKVYEDVLLKNLEFVIFKNNCIYEIEYTLSDINDMRKYLSKILKSIDDEEIQKNYEIEMQKINSSNKWLANNGKNNGKSYEVNQNLSKDDYIKELQKRKSQV